MRPSNATVGARSPNRPNSPISGGIAGKSARNELRTPARHLYRGLPGTRRGGWPSCCAAIRAICRTSSGVFRSVHRDGQCHRATEFVGLQPLGVGLRLQPLPNAPVLVKHAPDSPRRHRRICRPALAGATHPDRIGVEIANDFPDLWGRLFEYGVVICLNMPWPFPDRWVGAERHATMGCRHGRPPDLRSNDPAGVFAGPLELIEISEQTAT